MLMKKPFVIIVFSIVLFYEKGFSLSDPLDIYKAGVIKEEMKKDAHTVKRFEKVELEISGSDKAAMHIHEVVTILNAKGNDELNFTSYTTKFLILEDVDIKLYDKDGKVIEKYKRKDLSSQAAGSGLVEDGNIFFLMLTASSYPVTIEKDYTIRFKGLYKIPTFYFSKPFQSVEYSIFQLKYPASMKVNYKAFHINSQPQKNSTGNEEVVQWEARDILSARYEERSGPWVNSFPHLFFNADKIEFDGYPGNLSTWKEMGLWYNSLLKNTNRLSLSNQEDIRKLIEGVKSDRDKIKILYTYLQNNFRYVSIQLGIGGFKPFPADFVHENKYGDCKGLSNYMEACLAAVNIRSYSAWVNSGDDDTYIDPDFPYDGFDHQILVVPLEKDTIWLECTSNYNEFAHLGSFTENRYALILTENGGILVKTPVSKSSDNTISANTVVNIGAEGGASINTQFSACGEFKYTLVNLSRESSETHKQYAINNLGFNNPDEFNIQFDQKESKPYTCTIDQKMGKIYEFKAGSKMFISPRMYRIWQLKLNPVEKREQDFFLPNPLQKTDTTRFQLPDGFVVESLPKNKKISFSLGQYESRYWMDEKSGMVYSVASLVINTSAIKPALYEEARIFFDQVLEDGNQKIILKNNN